MRASWDRAPTCGATIDPCAHGLNGSNTPPRHPRRRGLRGQSRGLLREVALPAGTAGACTRGRSRWDRRRVHGDPWRPDGGCTAPSSAARSPLAPRAPSIPEGETPSLRDGAAALRRDPRRSAPGQGRTDRRRPDAATRRMRDRPARERTLAERPAPVRPRAPEGARPQVLADPARQTGADTGVDSIVKEPPERPPSCGRSSALESSRRSRAGRQRRPREIRRGPHHRSCRRRGPHRARNAHPQSWLDRQRAADARSQLPRRYRSGTAGSVLRRCRPGRRGGAMNPSRSRRTADRRPRRCECRAADAAFGCCVIVGGRLLRSGCWPSRGAQRGRLLCRAKQSRAGRATFRAPDGNAEGVVP
jgi:hypothetical protein